MPKVLQINSCANWGSTGKIAEQINQMAQTNGWETYIAFGRSYNPSKSQLIHIGCHLSQAIALVEARLFDNEGLASFFVTKRLIRTIKILSPDIIHLHNLHGYYINYKLLFQYLNSTSIPVIWTLHDCWSFTGHCAHFVSKNCLRWKVECFKCPLKKDYPRSILMDCSKRNFQLKKSLFSSNCRLHLVPVSYWLAQNVKESFFSKTEITVINNGIDTSVFRPVVNESDLKKFRILAVASIWTKEKGLYDYYRIREMLNIDQYEITLVGLTKRQIRRLPRGINGICRTNSVNELVSLYSSADVVMSLSRGESLASTPLEGMACGTPAIVYNNTAHPEIVSEDTGIVVEQGNMEAIVDAVRKIEGVGKQYYSNACRKRVESLFDKEEQYKKYIELYNKLYINQNHMS